MSEQDNSDTDFVLVDSDRGSPIGRAVSIELGETQALDPKSGRIKRRGIIAGLVLLFLALTGYYYGVSSPDTFPAIPAGAYFGTISIPASGQSEELAFYLERGTEATHGTVAVLREGWEATQVLLDGNHPIVLSGADSELNLTGTISDSGFVGHVIESPSKREGRWSLAAIASSPALQDDGSVYERARLWLSLRAERRDVERSYAEREALVTRQKEEIERITKFLTEGDTLKARASERHDEAKRELESAQAQYAELQKKAQSLAQQLEISQKVISGGKLVGLARESLDREDRWLDSMLRSSGDIASTDLDSEMARAEQALSLKQKISELQAKLYQDSTPKGVDAFKDNY